MLKRAMIVPALTVIAGLFYAAAAQAAPPANSLIKLENDHNPATHEDEVVYYLDRDYYRHPFPNRGTFLSWYQDFSGVQEVDAKTLAGIIMQSNIVYRPGTRLVKIASVPKVYAVEPGGVLRWVETEAVAKALYGDDWNKRVDDVPEAFFVNYREGAPLTVPVWPTGTVVQRRSDDVYFYIDGLTKRHIFPEDVAAMRIDPAYVIKTDSRLDEYADAGISVDRKYYDTAQISYVDTLPQPAIDFPVTLDSLTPGADRSLYVFRLTAGMPVKFKGVSATLTGPLWSVDGKANFTNLRFVDSAGQNLFGSKQLTNVGVDPATVTWTGSYTLPANTISVIELRADVGSGLQAGSVIKVAIDRGSLVLTEGTAGTEAIGFYPKTAFPELRLTVK